MTKQEAEKILQLPQNYNLTHVKKAFKTLLRQFHPDVSSHLTKEEKEIKTREVIEAHKLLINIDQTKISLITFKEWLEELNHAEKIEKQIGTLNFVSVPEELRKEIEKKRQEFEMLMCTTKLQSYNLETESSVNNMKNYEQRYYKIRFDLTYIFFNYLEKNVQKSKYRECSMYVQNDYEYCKNGTPEILESLYAIVSKFLNYFAMYLKEKEKIQTEIQMKSLLEMEERKKNCLLEVHSSELEKKINDFFVLSVENLAQICKVDPLKTIDNFALDQFLENFNNNLKRMVESYQFFLENKERFLLQLEEAGVSQDSCATLFNIEENSTFETEVLESIQSLSAPGYVLEDERKRRRKLENEGRKY